jgi:hypothetical protein
MSDEQTPVDAPPPDHAPVEATPEAAPVDDDAAIEQNAIDIPDGDRLVPLSVVAPLREKVRTLKPKAERADQLEAELAQVKARQQESAPIIEAARAIVQAAQAAQQPQPQPVAPQDDPELQEIARDFDLWKPDGSLDVDRAKRIQQRETARARAIAEETTAPMVARTLQQEASYNLARAKNTKLPDGTAADPQILENLWRQLSNQPGGLQTLANPDNAVHVWNQALAYTMAAKATARPTSLPTATAPTTPPLYTETAGGGQPALPKLTSADKRTAQELGITEAEYAKTLAEMPAGWGKSR